MSFTKTLSKQLWVGGASTYNITDFYFLKNAHVKVYVYTSGVPSLKTEGVDYNLTGAGNPSGGQITWIGTAPTALQQVLAQRVIPNTQQTDYQNFDGTPSDVLENDLDLAVMRDQQNEEEISRALTVPINVTGFNTELPTTLTPNRALVINAAGDGLELSENDPDGQVDAAAEQVVLAQAQATASANSATASANSATAAANSATDSANSATASANSATASANSATAAANSAASINPASFNASGTFQFSADIQVDITADENNYNPSGLGTCNVIRNVNSVGGVRTVTGLQGGADGRIIFWFNGNTSSPLTLAHENAGSAAANRFFCPGSTNFTLAPRSGVILVYDSTTSRWRVVDQPGISLATSAEVRIGTDTTKAITPDALRAAIGFSAYYESPQQNIAANTQLNLAHGLSRKPVLVLVVLQCVTAQLAYSVGDEVYVNVTHDQGGTASNFSIVPDATNVNIRVGNAISILAKDNSAGTAVTFANWRLVVRAWA